MSFFRDLLTKLTGSTEKKNTHPIPHIDGAENILVDSSVLCCPVCYNVYSSTPSILHCGHTFCTPCLQRMINTPHLAQVINYETIIPCPMCRVPSTTKRLCKNYLVEDLLEKVTEYNPEEDGVRAATATYGVARKRMAQKYLELEQKHNALKKEMDDYKKFISRQAFAIVSIVVFFKFIGYFVQVPEK